MKMIALIILFLGITAQAQHNDHSGCTSDGHEEAPVQATTPAEQVPPPTHSEEDHHDAHPFEDEESSLEIETAAGGVVKRTVSFPAEIQINRDRAASVSPKYAGTIREFRVEIGDPVKNGDVLATIESRETLTSYSLTAPLTGTVVSRTKSAGELAGEGDMLFEIVDLSSVWVEVHLFPQYRNAIHKGQPILLIASDGHTEETILDYVSPLIDPETRTVKARCVLADSGNHFPPGAFVRARIAVESVQAAIRVEKEAVQTINGESIVFIQDEDGIEPRDVQPGISDGTFVEIKSGLEPGEKYIARGAFDLKAELVTSGLDPHAGHGH